VYDTVLFRRQQLELVLAIVLDHLSCLRHLEWITNFLELSHSREAANCAATQELSAFYGTRKFITVFTRAFHWFLSRDDQSNPYHPILSLYWPPTYVLVYLVVSFLLAFPLERIVHFYSRGDAGNYNNFEPMSRRRNMTKPKMVCVSHNSELLREDTSVRNFTRVFITSWHLGVNYLGRRQFQRPGELELSHNDISFCWVYELGSRDSTVGIATGYGLDDRGIGVRVPVGPRIFSCRRRPDRVWGTPSLLSSGYRGLFLRG
jgi:hypothetical protein